MSSCTGKAMEGDFAHVKSTLTLSLLRVAWVRGPQEALDGVKATGGSGRASWTKDELGYIESLLEGSPVDNPVATISQNCCELKRSCVRAVIDYRSQRWRRRGRS